MSEHIHFIGICGRAMGSLAIELSGHGVRVTGSDRVVFPPMDQTLRSAGITFHETFDAAHLRPAPDCVIIGSYLTPANPEVAAVLERRIPWQSLPAFLGDRYLQTGNNIVVAGTNGKTTTTAMLAWILQCAGRRPDYLIGGKARNLSRMMRLRNSRWRVIEGDEYLCGLGDLNPKFVHYRPRHAIVTNVHWDHFEVFKSEDHYRAGFHALVDLVPPSGYLVLNAGDEGSRALAARRRSASPDRTVTVGFDRGAGERITALRTTRAGTRFRLAGHSFKLAAHGRINVQNAAMAATMALRCGVKPAKIAEALARWRGVEGRQEILWQSGGLTVISEEAYHPHSLGGALEAARAHFPRELLTVVLQPRYTGGLGGSHQRELPDALSAADRVVVTDSLEITQVPKPFSSRRLCAALRKRKCRAQHKPSLKEIIPILPELLADTRILLVSVAYRNEFFFEALNQALENVRSE